MFVYQRSRSYVTRGGLEWFPKIKLRIWINLLSDSVKHVKHVDFEPSGKNAPPLGPSDVIDLLLDNRGKLWILTEAQIFIIDKAVKKVVFKCGKRFCRKAKFLGIKAKNQGSHVYVFHQNFLNKPIYSFTEF
jgi:hypothetical protein